MTKPIFPAPILFWTRDRISLLIKLWSDGLKITEIASRIETTKNAVIGKLYRLGYCREVPFITTSMVRLRALDRFYPDGRCAWPFGREVNGPDFHFCGESVAFLGASYCEKHHHMAWVKPKVNSKLNA
jgi:hypothetical protein